MVNKKLVIILIVLNVVLLSLIVVFLLTLSIGKCSTQSETRTVHGISMSPIIKDGQEVKLIKNYYNCHKVGRNDIIAYNYSGDINPLIKIVKGIPGDKFSMQSFNNSQEWKILINGSIIYNSENKPYLLTQSEYNLLLIYEDSYKGIIPDNAYLILGDVAPNSIDSRHFGLIDKSDIIGKIVL